MICEKYSRSGAVANLGARKIARLFPAEGDCLVKGLEYGSNMVA